MLDLIHVSKILNDKLIINDCSITIAKNRIYGLVGTNGVGKSTLLRLIAGVYKQDNGTILFNNNTIYNNYDIKKDILYIPDNLNFSNFATIKNMYDYFNIFYNIDYNYFMYLIKILDLSLKMRFEDISKGMRKRIYIALALSIDAKLLLLDETFDGLDYKAKYIFKKELLKLKETKDLTVILASHSIRELNDFVDGLTYLKDGKLINYNDFYYHEKTIYRVITDIDSIDNLDLKILRVNKNDKLFILDIIEDKDKIINAFKDIKHSILSIDTLPFSEWILCQMEVSYEH